MDIGAVIGELERIGYTSSLLVEYRGEDPLNLLPQDVHYLRGLQPPTSQQA